MPLSRAVREELVPRNVARLVELSARQPDMITPWSSDEALRFLKAARPDPLYPAFLVLYGMRRGEVLGLRWQDVDFDAGLIRVRQQIQRIQGRLVAGPVKTRMGNRDLPLAGLARDALAARRDHQDAGGANLGAAWPSTGLVFTTCTGRLAEPRNLVRSFARIRDRRSVPVWMRPAWPVAR